MVSVRAAPPGIPSITWSAAVFLCWLSALRQVASQGVVCIWDATLGDGLGSCVPDLEQFSEEDVVAGLGPFLEVATCRAEQTSSDVTLTGCGLDSVECETVTFTDSLDEVCAPTGNSLTSGAEFAELFSTWDDCASGVSTVGCEEAAQDWFGTLTGCTACGPAAGNLEIAVTECYKYESETTCGSDTTTSTSVEGTAEGAAPPTAISSPSVGATTSTTGDVEAMCVWGDESGTCLAFPTGTDSVDYLSAFLAFAECFMLNDATTSGCPTDAPAACSTFFDDTTTPFCLPSTGTWTTPEEFMGDAVFLSEECRATVSATCADAAASLYTNMGCPECADEASAVYTAGVACDTATLESECTEGLATGDTTGATTGSTTTTSTTATTPPTTTTSDPPSVFGPDPTTSEPSAVAPTTLTFGGAPSTTDTTSTTTSASPAPTSTAPDETTTSTDRGSDIFPDATESGTEQPSEIVANLPNDATLMMRSGLLAACLAVAVALLSL